MKHRAGSIGILLAALALLGAGEGSPHEKVIQEMIGSAESIGVTLKTIIDEDSAAAAKPNLRKAADTFTAARSRAEKLQPPEKDEKARLEKLYKPKLKEALEKMFTEVRRVENIPGGKEALKEISGVLKKDSK
jgi:hypothetical protein